MKAKCLGTLALMALIGQSAMAMKVNDSLEIKGDVRAFYRMDTTSGNTTNTVGMEVDEAEMDLIFKLDDNWSAGLGFLMSKWANQNTDGSSSTGLTGGANGGMAGGVFIGKRAYVRGNNLWHDGSRFMAGMHSSPWSNNIEQKWGMNWLDGHTLALHGGWMNRFDTGYTFGGDVGAFSYDFGYYSGEDFYKNTMKNDNIMSMNIMLGYKIMDGMSAHLQIDNSGAGKFRGTEYKSVLTTSLALMYKTGSMFDFLFEYHMLPAKVGDAYTNAFGAGSVITADKSYSGYALHVNSNINEKWGFWGRYATGNKDYTDAAGLNNTYGQWNLITSGGTNGNVIKDRMTIGPTYAFVPKTVVGAFVYDTASLTDGAKVVQAVPVTGLGISSLTQMRLHLVALF